MVYRIEIVYPYGLNKGFSLRFCVSSLSWHETPEERQKTYWSKCCEYNNKDEVNSSNIGGARGVMVIVVGNGHGDTSSNPGRDW